MEGCKRRRPRPFPAGPSEKRTSILYRARPPDDPPEKVVVVVAVVRVEKCEFMWHTIKGFGSPSQ